MSQIWKGDKVVPVTVLLAREEDCAKLADLKEGELVKVSGKSKGKGFQGVVKRHGFHGGPKSHGQKDKLRAPGSIGATAPQRVIKGKKMPGHMGNKRVTVKNLRIVSVEKERGFISLKGAVPGRKGTLIEVYSLKEQG